MKYKTKWKIKKISIYTSLSLILLLGVLLFAYLNSRIIETALCVVLFYIYRSAYNKQFHTYSLIQCTVISITVFAIVSAISLPLQLSVFSSILIIYFLTYFSYKLRDLIDNTVLLESYKLKLKKFDNKCIENLTENELQERLPKIPYDVVHIVYGYLHKPKTLNATGYALKCNISEATLYRYLKKVKESYENT